MKAHEDKAHEDKAHQDKAHEKKEHEDKAHEEKAHEKTELERLDAAERAGELLTGAQRGRLADLRCSAILQAVEAMLHHDKTPSGKTVETATIPSHLREHRK